MLLYPLSEFQKFTWYIKNVYIIYYKIYIKKYYFILEKKDFQKKIELGIHPNIFLIHHFEMIKNFKLISFRWSTTGNSILLSKFRNMLLQFQFQFILAIQFPIYFRWIPNLIFYPAFTISVKCLFLYYFVVPILFYFLCYNTFYFWQ